MQKSAGVLTDHHYAKLVKTKGCNFTIRFKMIIPIAGTNLCCPAWEIKRKKKTKKILKTSIKFA